jgi:hypothetical protein
MAEVEKATKAKKAKNVGKVPSKMQKKLLQRK